MVCWEIIREMACKALLAASLNRNTNQNLIVKMWNQHTKVSSKLDLMDSVCAKAFFSHSMRRVNVIRTSEMWECLEWHNLFIYLLFWDQVVMLWPSKQVEKNNAPRLKSWLKHQLNYSSSLQTWLYLFMVFLEVSGLLVTIHTFEDGLVKLFTKLIDKIAG